MSQHLEQLLDELRAEQIPSRPSSPAPARTEQQQTEARRVLAEETAAYERDHPTDQHGHRPRLQAVS